MTERPIPSLFAAARDILGTLAGVGTPACLIGALAVQRWGQPRATADVDVSVLAPYGEERPILDILLERFEPRQSGAREFALAHRVLLLRTTEGVAIDVALAAFPFELEALDHASTWEPIGGVVVRTCSAEDLIIYKLVAARQHDLVDVEGIVRRQHATLDIERIRTWGAQFAELKEEPDLLRPFEAALKRII